MSFNSSIEYKVKFIVHRQNFNFTYKCRIVSYLTHHTNQDLYVNEQALNTHGDIVALVSQT